MWCSGIATLGLIVAGNREMENSGFAVPTALENFSGWHWR